MAKMSKAMKGHTNHKGHKHTAVAKAKISAKTMGNTNAKKRSAEAEVAPTRKRQM